MSFSARCAGVLTQGQTGWSIPLPKRLPLPVVSALARACAAGELTAVGIEARLQAALGREWGWIRPLADRYVAAFGGRTRPRLVEVESFLRGDAGLRRGWGRDRQRIRVERRVAEAARMQPVAAAAEWPVANIESVGELAAWLRVDAGELEWFADLKGMGYRGGDARLQHYFYRALRKSSGGVRMIEAPKQRLKTIQRRVLAGILEQVPAHAAAHGFVRGRSIRTFAAPHVGRAVVMRMDLKDFFPSFRAARVQALFRTVGYPDAVAGLLTGICTNVVPWEFWKGLGSAVTAEEMWDARGMYSRPHLPQGATTSPALANLCCYRLDCRLSGLAAAIGAEYTRYADDLAFSGDEALGKCVLRLEAQVAAIAAEEGLAVNHCKTRVMRQDARQYLAGVVVNRRVNVVRKDFDELKAVLYNCAVRGVEGQNREGHPAFRERLMGRVAFVESLNPAKGRRLREMLGRIEWE